MSWVRVTELVSDLGLIDWDIVLTRVMARCIIQR